MTSSPSGSLSYTNQNERLPFTLNYSGGYTWNEAGSPYSTGLFQHLALSQGFVWSRWNLAASEDVSYLPQAPTTGFSGIPGIGEPIGQAGSTTTPNQTILTLNTHSVSNSAGAQIGHTFNHWASLSFGGNSELLRFPDGNGLDTNGRVANASLSWRLDARNSVSASYQFSQFSYPRSGVSFTTNSGLLGFKRAWNRKITSNISAGPQWTGSSTGFIPSSTSVAANAAIDYHFRNISAGLSYNRGVNGGSGYMFGAETDSVNGNLSRQFGRDLEVGIEGSYRRMAELRKNGVTNGKYGGVQANRRIGRYLSVFANYTAMDQSSSSPLPANVLSRLIQEVGFGIEFSPRETHLKQ
jgi:hypothetical protein